MSTKKKLISFIIFSLTMISKTRPDNPDMCRLICTDESKKCTDMEA